MANLWPLIVIGAGVLLTRAAKTKTTPLPGGGSPKPLSLAQKKALPLAKAIDLGKYPGRAGARGGGLPAFIKDWGPHNVTNAAGKVYDFALAASRSKEAGVDFRARAEWLYNAIANFFLG